MPGGDFGFNYDSSGLDLRKYLPSSQPGAFITGLPTLNPDGTITIVQPGATDAAQVGTKQPLTGPGLASNITAPEAPKGGFKWPETPNDSPESIVGNPQIQQAAAAVKAAADPEKTFNQKLLELAKNGNFTGALAALAGAGGPKASAGAVPTPHFQVGHMTPVSPPTPIKASAAALMRGAGGPVDLRLPTPGALKRGAGEQDRYDLLRKRSQQDALKGLLG
jgi:hypothetical protein